MKIRVMNITDIDKFFRVIDRCEGKVELITENGDIYNLNSKLSQFASLAKVCFNGKIPVAELVIYCPSDAGKIMNYMMNNMMGNMVSNMMSSMVNNMMSN